MSDKEQEPAGGSRYVDMRIPLWGVLTSAVTVGFFLVSMWFTTNQTAKDVSDLQLTVKAGNTQVNTLAGQQTLLEFRQGNVESELRIIKDMMARQPIGRGHDAPAR